MKVTSLKTIYLQEHELKQAIVEYLEKEHEELAQHLYDNECEMDWNKHNKEFPNEFLVSIDGEISETTEIDINATANKVIEDHKEALQKLADTPSAICDACGARTHEFETIFTETMSGVVMCSGEAKERCKEVAANRNANHKKGCYVWAGGECICKPNPAVETFYVCGVGLQHDPEIRLHRTVEGLKFHKPCWKECGIVKVSVTEDEWVEEQDLFGEKNTKWYNCAHCDAGYQDQECTCDDK